MRYPIETLAAIFLVLGVGSASAQPYQVVTPATAGSVGGHVAFVDTARGRIVQVDRGGHVVWQCPVSRFARGGDLSAGTDLEHVGGGRFLVAVPFSGIYRVNSNCTAEWRHLTTKISHDADQLANGNVLHTFGWDNESDPQAVELNPAGQVVWRWNASGIVDPAWRREGGPRERRPSWSHANAVQRLPGGDTLVSLRNMNRVVRVRRDGSIAAAYGPIPRVHEPSLLGDGSLLAARRNPTTVIVWKDGTERTIFANRIRLSPIRTVERLRGGGILVTGADAIAEVDRQGNVVWHLRVSGGGRGGIYKAVHVPR